MKYWLQSILLLFAFHAVAQPLHSRYFVAFNDKEGNRFSLEQPAAFLSVKSLERRQKQHIPVTIEDLPVSSTYVQDVHSAGTLVICTSKWMNGIVVETDDAQVIAGIAAMPFVREVRSLCNPALEPSRIQKFTPAESQANNGRVGSSFRISSFNYGLSANQVQMIHCDYLHDSGFDGAGKIIALLDAGYYRVDSLDAFDSIRINNKILGTWDFVQNEAEVYNDDSHGMEVLSCIAANIPGTLVGTAPQASFFLLRTEDNSSETIVEEYYWAAGVEYADSAGADIISTSLGYNTFDDATQNHTYSDMDGHTTVAALAANHAASVGMLVVASAGNYGAGSWNYITTPADADSAMAIGAVGPTGTYWPSSSNGPSSDGDVKPNVATQGQDAAIFFPGNYAAPASGTSFAAPILAGAAACLWQAFDTLTNMEIFHAIESSASQFTFPDTLLGYDSEFHVGIYPASYTFDFPSGRRRDCERLSCATSERSEYYFQFAFDI